MWNDLPNVLDRLFTAMGLGLLASFGAAAHYVYITVTQERSFHWLLFLCNLFVAFFVGVVFGEFVDSENKYRYGGVMLAGFFAYPLLGIVEDKGKKWIEKWVGKQMR